MIQDSISNSSESEDQKGRGDRETILSLTLRHLHPDSRKNV